MRNIPWIGGITPQRDNVHWQFRASWYHPFPNFGFTDLIDEQSTPSMDVDPDLTFAQIVAMIWIVQEWTLVFNLSASGVMTAVNDPSVGYSWSCSNNWTTVIQRQYEQALSRPLLTDEQNLFGPISPGQNSIHDLYVNDVIESYPQPFNIVTPNGVFQPLSLPLIYDKPNKKLRWRDVLPQPGFKGFPFGMNLSAISPNPNPATVTAFAGYVSPPNVFNSDILTNAATFDLQAFGSFQRDITVELSGYDIIFNRPSSPHSPNWTPIVSINMKATKFFPFQNRLGQPVYDTSSGSQINDPFA